MAKRETLEDKLELIAEIITEEVVVEEMMENFGVDNVELLQTKYLKELIEYLKFEYTIPDEDLGGNHKHNKDFFEED